MNESKSDIENICSAPFLSISIGPQGDFTLCCNTISKISLGNWKEQSILEGLNSNVAKNVRKQMLDNKQLKCCHECFDNEESKVTSNRHIFNETFPPVQSLLEKESFEAKDIKHLDLWFSNFCNFKCRTCEPNKSSSWVSDGVKIGYPKPENFSLTENHWKELREIAPHLKKVYFAGGEPFLQQEHFRFLELLKEVGNTDIHLAYNTNLSKTKWKGEEIYKLLAPFKKISLNISIDGVNKQGEYIRSGMNYDQTVKNIKHFQFKLPQAFISLYCTLSVLNCRHIVPTIHQLVTDQLVPQFHFIINPLTFPEAYNIQYLPEKVKQELIMDYVQFIAKNSQNTSYSAVNKALLSLKSFLQNKKDENNVEQFFDLTNKLDLIREESFQSLFPETFNLLKKFDPITSEP